MTSDEVRIALGLEPFPEFAAKRMEQWKGDAQRERELGKKEFRRFLQERRGTGRTMRMICELLSDVSEGHVVHVVGHNSTWSRDLIHMARGYAAQLGLDAGKIVPSPHKAQRVYRDHYFPIAQIKDWGV
jgi:hypothetical protein